MNPESLSRIGQNKLLSNVPLITEINRVSPRYKKLSYSLDLRRTNNLLGHFNNRKMLLEPIVQKMITKRENLNESMDEQKQGRLSHQLQLHKQEISILFREINKLEGGEGIISNSLSHMRIKREQIFNYLLQHFDQKVCEMVIKNLRLPNSMSFDKYLTIVEQLSKLSPKEIKLFCFQVYDFDEDSVITTSDLVILIRNPQNIEEDIKQILSSIRLDLEIQKIDNRMINSQVMNSHIEQDSWRHMVTQVPYRETQQFKLVYDGNEKRNRSKRRYISQMDDLPPYKEQKDGPKQTENTKVQLSFNRFSMIWGTSGYPCLFRKLLELLSKNSL